MNATEVKYAQVRAVMTKLVHLYGSFDLWESDEDLELDAEALINAVESVID